MAKIPKQVQSNITTDVENYNLLKTIDPNKVAIYIRWSTEDQSNGTTLEEQLESCKYYILSQGWNYNENLLFIDDGFSGGTLIRPAMTEMRKQIQDKLIDCVVVLKLDRLSRNVGDTVDLILKEWGKKVVFKSTRESIDTSTQIGRQMLYTLSSFAEFERGTIKERTLSGKLRRAKEGKNSGFQYPYGYCKGTNNLFEIVPEEAEIVKYIFNEYISGRGAYGIAEDLNSKGIQKRIKKSKKRSWSGRWSGNSILYILQNKIYVGILEYGKYSNNSIENINEGESYLIKNPNFLAIVSQYVPLIIDSQTFDTAQTLRMERNGKFNKTSGRVFSSNHLLSGIAKCWICGYGIIGVPLRQGEKHAYYCCQGKKNNGKSFCNSGLIRQDILDNSIIERLKTDFLTKEKFNKIKEQYEEHYGDKLNNLKLAIRSLEQTIQSFDSKFNRIEHDYTNGDMDIKTYNRFYNNLEKEKNSAIEKLAESQKEYETYKTKNMIMEDLEKLPLILKQWDSLSIIEQKLVIRKYISCINVRKLSGKNNPAIDYEIIYQHNSNLS
jgi:site-specific DNA recombinase